MQTRILLSIKPRFAEQIFIVQVKRYEFRRVFSIQICFESYCLRFESDSTRYRRIRR